MMIHFEVRQNGGVWRAQVPGLDSCWAEASDPERACNLIKIQLLHWVAESLSAGKASPDNSIVFVPHLILESAHE